MQLCVAFAKALGSRLPAGTSAVHHGWVDRCFSKIEPWGWVVNRSLARTETTDPLLQRRIMGEAAQIARIRNGLARRIYLLPFLAEPPVGCRRFCR
jgi:hypothetical protein